LQIDQRSERVARTKDDFELKKFTVKTLSTIFSHQNKMEYFDEILKKMNYPLAKQVDLKKHRACIGAIYGSYHDSAKKLIQSFNLVEMLETDVINEALITLDFMSITDDLVKEAIVIDAFSDVLYERSPS
jgi:hypothetical protein